MSTFSSANALEYYIPTESPLSLKESRTIPPEVIFRGKVKIVAECQIYYRDSKLMGLFLRPVKEAIKILPALSKNGYNKPKEIDITNYSEVINFLISNKVLNITSNGGSPIAHGKAVFVLSDYAASWDCDHPNFWEKVEKVEVLLSNPILGEKYAYSGC